MSLGQQASMGRVFPSRWVYAESELEGFNDSHKIGEIIQSALHPLDFEGTDFDHSQAIEHVNNFLRWDGYEAQTTTKGIKVRELRETPVVIELPPNPTSQQLDEFIEQQANKCDRKLKEQDYDGAITNARTLVEAVLRAIELSFDNAPTSYDGNLPKLYKRVQDLLHLNASQYKEHNYVMQVLSGLSSIIHGLAKMSSELGDRHVRTKQPKPHHAELAVNTAKTFCHFAVSSFQHQREQTDQAA